VQAMQRSFAPLLGPHDFAAYQGAGSFPRTTVCTVTAAECVGRGSRIRVTISADRFLRHMMRMIVGTLVRVGAGRLSENAPAEFPNDAGTQRTGPTARPHGLYLVRVDYQSPAAAVRGGV